MATVADYSIELIKDKIRIRSEKMQDVTKEYNRLQRIMDTLKEKEIRLQKKLDVLQEKAETMACENFADKDELNSIITKKLRHGFSNATN